MSAYPAHPDPDGPGGWSSDLGTTGFGLRSCGIATALEGTLPNWAADGLKVFVGISGALVLIAAVVTAIAGADRLAFSLARRDMLPRVFGRLGKRVAGLTGREPRRGRDRVGSADRRRSRGREVRFLASLYSFGMFIAFTRPSSPSCACASREPELARPFRVPGSIRIRGRRLPVLPLRGRNAHICALDRLARHARSRADRRARSGSRSESSSTSPLARAAGPDARRASAKPQPATSFPTSRRAIRSGSSFR